LVTVARRLSDGRGNEMATLARETVTLQPSGPVACSDCAWTGPGHPHTELPCAGRRAGGPVVAPDGVAPKGEDMAAVKEAEIKKPLKQLGEIKKMADDLAARTAAMEQRTAELERLRALADRLEAVADKTEAVAQK
jgi:hypothetical protein